MANEVETEQVVDGGIDWVTGQPLWSAVVQVRGSVPLFWSQQATSLSPKPDILLQQFDPVYEVRRGVSACGGCSGDREGRECAR